LLFKGVDDRIEKIEIRCVKCGKRIFDGSPGMDYLGIPKVIELKCPHSYLGHRCGAINIITCRIEEKVVVRLKE
jgi:phage FluMu protein Com